MSVLDQFAAYHAGGYQPGAVLGLMAVQRPALAWACGHNARHFRLGQVLQPMAFRRDMAAVLGMDGWRPMR
jgi:hypothetical protein